ncbi:MAG: hypothetical protein PHR16_16695 [Methylovulum sp.]|nr:hypothetical protein [Methylovulum sp.]
MSYCRWSSDNFKCDLYCYESASGFVTHVATRKYDYEGEMPPVFDDAWTPEQTVEAHKKRQEILDASQLVPIGLPFDGESYVDGTLEEFRERLTALRASGYRFPDDVFEQIDEEIAGDREG